MEEQNAINWKDCLKKRAGTGTSGASKTTGSSNFSLPMTDFVLFSFSCVVPQPETTTTTTIGTASRPFKRSCFPVGEIQERNRHKPSKQLWLYCCYESCSSGKSQMPSKPSFCWSVSVSFQTHNILFLTIQFGIKIKAYWTIGISQCCCFPLRISNLLISIFSLLFTGANINLRDPNKGFTALEWAEFCGRRSCAEIIRNMSAAKSSSMSRSKRLSQAFSETEAWIKRLSKLTSSSSSTPPTTPPTPETPTNSNYQMNDCFDDDSPDCNLLARASAASALCTTLPLLTGVKAGQESDHRIHRMRVIPSICVTPDL